MSVMRIYMPFTSWSGDNTIRLAVCAPWSRCNRRICQDTDRAEERADILGWGGDMQVLIVFSIETVVHHHQRFYLTIQSQYKCKTDSKITIPPPTTNILITVWITIRMAMVTCTNNSLPIQSFNAMHKLSRSTIVLFASFVVCCLDDDVVVVRYKQIVWFRGWWWVDVCACIIVWWFTSDLLYLCIFNSLYFIKYKQTPIPPTNNNLI